MAGGAARRAVLETCTVVPESTKRRSSYPADVSRWFVDLFGGPRPHVLHRVSEIRR